MFKNSFKGPFFVRSLTFVLEIEKKKYSKTQRIIKLQCCVMVLSKRITQFVVILYTWTNRWVRNIIVYNPIKIKSTQLQRRRRLQDVDHCLLDIMHDNTFPTSLN